MRFVNDEDMPRSLGPALQDAGHEPLDVRDHGLRGVGDAQILQFALDCAAVLITEHIGFANLFRFSAGSHFGIVIVRFPSTLPTGDVVTAVIDAIHAVEPADIDGALLIVQPGRIRIRRPRP